MTHRFALLVAGLLLTLPATAQVSPPAKYWIFFTDKGAAKTQAAEPDYLTEAAHARRALRATTSAATFDAPIHAPYVQTLDRAGIVPQVQSRWFNAVSAYLTPDEQMEVQALPFVRAVRPVGRLAVPDPIDDAAPPPPYAAGKSALLDYGSSETQLAVMNAIGPLESGYNGAGVILGFLDTTFGTFTHPVFQRLVNENRLIAQEDFTTSIGGPQTNTHGLRVASIAVGYAEGELIGPGWGASVLAATTEYAPSETNAEEDAFVAGLEWMERMGADVVNISLGYNLFDSGQQSYMPTDLDGDTGITTRAADLAVALGIVVVAAAGNEGSCSPPSPSCWHYINTPADGDSVIAVGAVQPDSTRSSFSSYGPTADGRIKPDVAAQGSSVYIALPSGGYGFGQGTSFASPLVAGVVTQMLQANPALTPIEVRDLLRQTASQGAAPDTSLGWGIVNAEAAIQAALALVDTDDAPAFADALEVYPNPARGNVVLHLTTSAPATARLAIYNLLGQRVYADPAWQTAPGLNARTLDVRTFAPGLYVYAVETGRRTYTGRLVVAQ